MTIASRWQLICDQIATAQQPQTTTAHKQFADNYPTPARIVATIAVSKRQVVDSIQQAYKAGARNFAESFLQEALPKIEQLVDFEDIVWHFIGPIQSNKPARLRLILTGCSLSAAIR